MIRWQAKWLVLFVLVMSVVPASGQESGCNDLNLELDTESWFKQFKVSLSADQYKRIRQHFMDEAQLDLKRAQWICNNTLSSPTLATTTLEEIKGNF